MDKPEGDNISEKVWFYRFELPDGSVTATYDDGALDAVHDTRLAMLESVLAKNFGSDLEGQKAVDLACHQGWFATKLAQRGADTVVAVDARAEHIADATMIGGALGLENLQCIQSDVHALDPANLGTFDVVLMLGLIYHLENPIGALRLAQSLTVGGGGMHNRDANCSRLDGLGGLRKLSFCASAQGLLRHH